MKKNFILVNLKPKINLSPYLFFIEVIFPTSLGKSKSQYHFTVQCLFSEQKKTHILVFLIRDIATTRQ